MRRLSGGDGSGRENYSNQLQIGGGGGGGGGGCGDEKMADDKNGRSIQPSSSSGSTGPTHPC